jgi:hypothetical protein
MLKQLQGKGRFIMGWKGGKIVKFAWGGPKGGKVEY